MLALLKQYFNIAFLMGKPQDLPSGESQMYTAVVLNFVTYVLALISFAGFGGAMLHAAIDIGCSALFLYIALKYTAQLPRFHQALGAICGAGAVLNLAAIPMLQLTREPIDQAGNSIAMLASFVLLVWGLSLVGHVLRHTFGITMFTSIGIAVMYYLLVTSLLGAVFPPETMENDTVSGLQPLERIWVAQIEPELYDNFVVVR